MNKVIYTPSQSAVIEKTDGKMIVSASAGSGKTTVMIERIISLVKKRVGLEKIVALTFTDASARDMKAKLERKIAELCAEDGAYRAELEKVPFVAMCTVDSLCKSIVTEYFEIAGIDPGFDILDDGEKEAFSKRAFEQATDEMRLDEGFYALTKFFDSHDKLKDALERTATFLASLPDEEAWLTNVATSAITADGEKSLISAKLARIKNCARRYLGEIEKFGPTVCAHPYVTTRVECIKEILEANAMPALDKEAKVASYSKVIETLTGDARSVRDWGTEAWDSMKKIRDYEHVPVNDEAKALTSKYVEVLKRYLSALRAIKREENKFDFADVERMALEVLKDPKVRERTFEKYSYVFVDEYQDINELQATLIDLMTLENKFMVGDVKQSIYAFRHAEPGIFVRTVEGGEAEPIVLAENFRSASGVINAVNDVFSVLMEKDGGVDYKNEQMIASREYPETDLAPVYYTTFVKPEQKTELEPVYSVERARAERASSAEVEHVASAIFALVHGKQIYDADAKTIRPVKCSDIAVIVRSRGAFYFDLIKRLDEMGVPVSADRTRSDALEIKVLIDLIKLLDNQMQDVPLANVMLTMFGFSHEELVAIAKREKTFFDSVKSASEPKVVQFRQTLDDLRFVASYRRVDDVLKRALSVSGYEQRLSAVARENVVRMIESVGRMALNESVEKFLDGYEKLRDEIVGLTTGGEDTVKIMTMHASKGLEFPIVFVCDLGAHFPDMDLKGDFIRSKERGMVFKNVDSKGKRKSKNTAISLVIEEEKARLRHELSRLLYVAMTRAKNHLFMTGTAGSKGASPASTGDAYSFLQMLEYAYASGAPVPPGATEVGACEVGSSSGAWRESGVDLTALKKAMAYSYPHARAASTKVKYAVTALAVRDDEEWSVKPMFESEVVMRVGTVYHKVMEEISFDEVDVEHVQKAIDKMVELHTLTRAESSLVDASLISKALQSPTIRLASKTEGVTREHRFMLSVPGEEIGIDSPDDVLVQGVIDLMIPCSDGVILVDYKHTARGVEELKAKYAGQLDLYARAVESGLGVNVKRKVILSLKTGEEFDV